MKILNNQIKSVFAIIIFLSIGFSQRSAKPLREDGLSIIDDVDFEDDLYIISWDENNKPGIVPSERNFLKVDGYFFYVGSKSYPLDATKNDMMLKIDKSGFNFPRKYSWGPRFWMYNKLYDKDLYDERNPRLAKMDTDFNYFIIQDLFENGISKNAWVKKGGEQKIFFGDYHYQYYGSKDNSGLNKPINPIAERKGIAIKQQIDSRDGSGQYVYDYLNNIYIVYNNGIIKKVGSGQQNWNRIVVRNQKSKAVTKNGVFTIDEDTPIEDFYGRITLLEENKIEINESLLHESNFNVIGTLKNPSKKYLTINKDFFFLVDKYHNYTPPYYPLGDKRIIDILQVFPYIRMNSTGFSTVFAIRHIVKHERDEKRRMKYKYYWKQGKFSLRLDKMFQYHDIATINKNFYYFEELGGTERYIKLNDDLISDTMFVELPNELLKYLKYYEENRHDYNLRLDGIKSEAFDKAVYNSNYLFYHLKKQLKTQDEIDAFFKEEIEPNVVVSEPKKESCFKIYLYGFLYIFMGIDMYDW